MADFYRATRIELLDREYPGLKAFVDTQLTAGVSQFEICAMLEELYGEKCKVNPQTMSNYYRLVWWKEHNADIESWRNAKNQFRILQEEAVKDPECDSAKMIELLTINGIVQQREQIAATDPLKLMRELRQSQEAKANIENEKGKLEVLRQQAETEKRALELKIGQLEEASNEVEKQIESGRPVTREDIDRIRERVFGLPTRASEAATGAALPR